MYVKSFANVHNLAILFGFRGVFTRMITDYSNSFVAAFNRGNPYRLLNSVDSDGTVCFLAYLIIITFFCCVSSRSLQLFSYVEKYLPIAIMVS